MGFLQYLTSLGVLAPIITGFIFFKRLSDNIAKPFLYFLIILFVFELGGLYLGYRSIKNHIVYNIIDLITITFFIYFLIKDQKTVPIVFSSIVFIVTLFNFTLNDPFQFKDINYLIIYLYIGTQTSLLLFKSSNTADLYFFSSFRFWFYSGFIFSSFSSVSMYIFFQRLNNLEPNCSMVNYFSYFNFVITTMAYTSFVKAFTCKQ